MAILLLDDLRFEREITKKALERLIDENRLPQQDIIEASSLNEARKVYAARPDISTAILDVVLEGAADGIICAKEIQTANEIPVVLVTGSYTVSDIPVLRDWVMQGNGRDTAVDVCPKLGFHSQTLDQFVNELHEAISAAASKVGKGNNTKFYDKLIARTQSLSPPGLREMLVAIYKQIKSRLDGLANTFPDPKSKEILQQAPWLFVESTDVPALIHNMKKATQTYLMVAQIAGRNLAYQQEAQSLREHANLLLKLDAYVPQRLNRYVPNSLDILQEMSRLGQQERQAFPEQPSAKLRNRIALLMADKIPFAVVAPNGTLSEPDYNRISAITTRVIARSAGQEDSANRPRAGMFDSIPNCRTFEETKNRH